MSTRDTWMKTLVLLNKQGQMDVRCPICKGKSLQYKYFGDQQTRIGYMLFWCDSCANGIYISRVEVPKNEDIIPIRDIEAVKKETPDIKLIL